MSKFREQAQASGYLPRESTVHEFVPSTIGAARCHRCGVQRVLHDDVLDGWRGIGEARKAYWYGAAGGHLLVHGPEPKCERGARVVSWQELAEQGAQS